MHRRARTSSFSQQQHGGEGGNASTRRRRISTSHSLSKKNYNHPRMSTGASRLIVLARPLHAVQS